MSSPSQLLLVPCFALLVASGAGQGLESLSTVRAGTSLRTSSHDRTGGNTDALGPIAPGETHLLLETTGSGVIRHLWFTASAFPGHETVLRDLVLRMTWDGAPTPSVEVPLGDFFALGHGRSYTFHSSPVAVGKNARALNCYWPMPFHRSARVELFNNGLRSVRSLYWNLDYELCEVGEDQGLFHAVFNPTQELESQSHEGNTTGTDNYVILDTRGEGHYVGCALYVDAAPGGWWGEGDEMLFVDDSPMPTIIGTGSEDYFCNAWGYSEPFSYAYYGAPLLEKTANGRSLTTVYRWHVPDPVRFKTSLRVTIERLFSGNVKNRYSSVAFWYQKAPISRRPPLPKGEANHPAPEDDHSTASKLRLHGTALEPSLRREQVPLRCVRVTGGLANGGGYLELAPEGRAIAVPIPVPAKGSYLVRLSFVEGEGTAPARAGAGPESLAAAEPRPGAGRRSEAAVGPVSSREGTVTVYIGGDRKVALENLVLEPQP